ncbi:hypothetical protein K5M76_06495 [Shewanella xiamenensis]|uniref:hypothetical protein n=1 Tax=Shewanella xiamenensis TaxID=332186 RepID=UPI00217F1555|nr:hypothetical protein [Shewanella xiamenensis]MCT8858325.1 hypothetical protein [Shewanella xiamenensis]UWG65871.1 hypothetical protein K5M76_06495 [Shewanella xiamenensis]
MSQHSQILAELGYKQRTNQEAGFRSDGQPYANRAHVSKQKRLARERARQIEDIQLAKELGISLQELTGAL